MENEGTFLGRRMAQSRKAIWLWEQLLSMVRFSRIIDIGTYNGNFSYYLALYCEERNAEFYTYDIRSFVKPKLVNKYFFNIDIFSKQEIIKSFIKKEGITILFCDGGNKIKEVETFCPALKSNDILVVHDWNIEIAGKNMPLDLVAILEKECEEEGYIKIFKKI